MGEVDRNEPVVDKSTWLVAWPFPCSLAARRTSVARSRRQSCGEADWGITECRGGGAARGLGGLQVASLPGVEQPYQLEADGRSVPAAFHGCIPIKLLAVLGCTPAGDGTESAYAICPSNP